MIKVTSIVELDRKPIENRKGYLIGYNEQEVNSWGEFVEYIAPENLPEKNQQFESARALENYCRGERE